MPSILNRSYRNWNSRVEVNVIHAVNPNRRIRTVLFPHLSRLAFLPTAFFNHLVLLLAPCLPNAPTLMHLDSRQGSFIQVHTAHRGIASRQGRQRRAY